MGYQRLRIFPYEYPIAWRVEVRAVNDAEASETKGTGAVERPELEKASYTSASENEYFGWKDAKNDTARELAQKFVERFPNLAAAGKGRDWAYAGWLIELIGEIERTGALPVLFAEYWEAEEGTLGIIFYDSDKPRQAFPLPPNCHGAERW
jgi:hypothetical protein